ncbi:MAG: aminomethyl-transferring glycine dehydrogenase subunit GcvPA [Eubacteriales bacterium]|nr:aminomethyl-transferring glycine dehydrogenase subunit GcvPA [Eubacteriales bacterium]MDD3200260.1 aminomethyl-transferring glycine dehydrogenase subunit GcvPA [Eubacteriales bacterium]MDD4629338.1 aminomethyl-transferring glycine dehydrogenase subunit GcvPA [Eubacteriales bacterium]
MSRYLGITKSDRDYMLKEIGVKSMRSLFSDVPEQVYLDRELNIPPALSEMELVAKMKSMSEKNLDLDHYTCFLGAGAYDHFIPAAIGQLLSRQEFFTAYTPYQPEISQGTLQSIFEYQTMICELTGMEVSNASMYDGATALTEAAIMASEAMKRKEILVAGSVHPESRKILKTYAQFRDLKITEVRSEEGTIDQEDLRNKLNDNTAALLIQSPNFFGIIEDLASAGEIVHQNKSLFIVSADPISLAILKSPGELGADIVVGEGQALGNPLSFGGPYLGFFAAKEKWMRKLPGRIVGQTKDKEGIRGFVLTLQTREQHIRREKATSNICSNQGLNALAAAMYMTFLGKEGLREVAGLSAQKAHYAYGQLLNTGKFTPIFNKPFFKEFAVKSEQPVEGLNSKLLNEHIIGGYSLVRDYPGIDGGWLISVTEKRTKDEIDKFVRKAAE